ncbi:MAG: DUF3870 domain-containing protein [Firmicutes bacterium]|nr:DUF3870 domain-containing protein [Bacillota bacterium]
MYDKNTVYIIGHGRTGTNNAITEQYKIFFIGFVVDFKTDEIVDLGCSVTIDTTEEFIASIFVGRKFDRFYEDIEQEVYRRYFGSSQKAIIVAYKDALKKYRGMKQEL